MKDPHSTPVDDPREQKILPTVPPHPTAFSIRHAKAETARERRLCGLDARTGHQPPSCHPITQDEGLRLDAQEVIRILIRTWSAGRVHAWLQNIAAQEATSCTEQPRREP